MYSGDARYIFRPWTSRGRPALGSAERGREVEALISRIASRRSAGPTLQLSPAASAPKPSTSRAILSGRAPYEVSPSGWIVISATTGRSVASRHPATASSSSVRSLKVSSTSRSAPPSARASACSRKASRASSRDVGPYGSSLTPSGPMLPATKRSSPASRRARRAPARLISATSASRP